MQYSPLPDRGGVKSLLSTIVRKFHVLAVVVLASSLNSPLLYSLSEIEKVLPSGIGPDTEVGWIVDISGDTAVMGAPEDDERLGSVFVFEKEGENWVEKAKLSGSDGAPIHRFGASVAIDGDTILVGAWEDRDQENPGYVYVFVRQGDSWVEEARLQGSTLGNYHHFGIAVSLSGDTAIVGASGIDGDRNDTGGAYVFTRSEQSWSEQALLVPSIQAVNGRFGRSVSISGDLAAIASEKQAFVFERSEGLWEEKERLFPNDWGSYDNFASDVSISGTRILVGASSDDEVAHNAGAAHVFRLEEGVWVEEAKLNAGPSSISASFGNQVSLSGNFAVVGALYYGEQTRPGKAFAFKLTDDFWVLEDILEAGDAEMDDRFGAGVAVDGSVAFVGAPEEDELGEDAGSGYIFKLGGTYGKPVPPAVIDQPVGKSAVQFDAVTFGVDSSSTSFPTLYQWQVSSDQGTTWETIIGANQPTYTLDIVMADMDGLLFRVLISSYGGTTVSDVVQLTVDDYEIAYPVPVSRNFKINDGDIITEQRLVVLNSEYLTGATPTDYRASEYLDFRDAEWRPFEFAPTFELSEGLGRKEVFLQIRDERASSEVVSDVISLSAPFVHVANLVSGNDPQANDKFGNAVAGFGDWIFVGAFGDSVEINQGSVFVFKRVNNAWHYHSTLLDSMGGEDDFFGREVAYSNGRLFVSASGYNDGSVIVFELENDEWKRVAELIALSSWNGDLEQTMIVDNDTVLLGSERTQDGEAFVFRLTEGSWLEEDSFTADDVESNDYFGSEVALRGDTAIIRSRGDNDSTGSAYVFQRTDSTWSQSEKLEAPEGIEVFSNGWLGFLGDEICYLAGTNNGIFFYRRNGTSWEQGAQLGHLAIEEVELASLIANADGTRIVVGAKSFVYVFQRTGNEWVQSHHISVFTRGNGPHLALSDDLLIVGDDGDRKVNLYDLSGDASNLQAPSIVDSPQDATVEEGDYPKLYAAAIGPIPMTYQWQVSTDDGVNWEDVPGQNYSHYEIDNVNRTQNGNWYRAMISNDYGSTPTEPALLTISNKPAETPYLQINNGAYSTISREVILKVTPSGGYPTEYLASEDEAFTGVSWLPFSEEIPFTLTEGLGEKRVYLKVRNPEGEPEATSDTIELEEAPPAPLFPHITVAPSDYTGRELFGSSVSIDGEVAVVGARSASIDDARVGAAYVFTKEGSNWIERAKLFASDPVDGHSFGSSSAIDGDTIVIGNPDHDGRGRRTGKAYVFETAGEAWIETVALLPDDVVEEDRFGISVAVQGDVILVGAPGDFDDTGRVYVYERSNNSWNLKTTLVPDGASKGDFFGSSIAIDGNRVVISSSRDRVNGILTGSAYIFSQENGEWSQEAKISNDGSPNENFGIDVSISGDWVAVGASSATDIDSNSGAAYLFNRNGNSWQRTGKIIASDLERRDYFGASVSIDGDLLSIGTTGSFNVGAAYLYRWNGNTWDHTAKLTAKYPDSRDRFGADLSLSGNTLLVAARQTAEGANFFDLSDAATAEQAPQIKRQPENDHTQATLSVVFEVWAYGTGPLQYQWETSTDDGATWSNISGATDRVYEIVSVTREMDEDRFRVTVSNSAGSVVSEEGTLSVFEYPAPILESLSLNYGNSTTSIRSVVPVVTFAPDNSNVLEYRVSEQFDFSDADWQMLPGQSRFLLSEGYGEKTLYIQYRNDEGESNVVNASIDYSPAAPFSFEPHEQFLPLFPEDGAGFGTTLDISGDTAVVGYPDGWEDGDNAYGSVFVYARNGGIWDLQTRLIPSDGAYLDGFGKAVAVDGDTIVVLAPRDDDGGDGTGSAYVFVRDGESWTQEAKVHPDDSEVEQGFGDTVAISGDSFIVGTISDDTIGHDTGSAYVFVRQNSQWAQQTKFLPEGDPFDHFGTSVEIAGDRAFVGSIRAQGPLQKSGAVYVYQRTGSTWDLETILSPSDGEEGDLFGSSLAVYGETLVVGAPESGFTFFNGSNDQTLWERGSVYIYTNQDGDWHVQAKLQPEDLEQGLYFGASVSIENSYIIVGSTGNRDRGNNTGTAYLYGRDPSLGWIKLAVLSRPDARSYDLFGTSVGISNGQVLVGASSPILTGQSVYCYDLSFVTLNQAPQMALIDDMEVDERSALIFNLEATDLETGVEDLSFGFTGPSFGATIDPDTGSFNWTPEEGQGPATYLFIVHVTDGYKVDSVSFQVRVNARFDNVEEWLQDVFEKSVPDENRAMDADIDLDGLINLMEYIFGLDPETHDSGDAVLLDAEGTDGKLRFTTWLRGDPTVSLAVLISEDMKDWNNIGLLFNSVAGTWSTSSGELSISATSEISPGLWEVTMTDEQGYNRLFVRIMAGY